MNKSIMAHTQIIATLSLNFVTTNDNGQDLAVIPLLSLTRFIMLIWVTRQAINRVKYNLVTLAQDIKNSIPVKVVSIVCVAILWGLEL